MRAGLLFFLFSITIHFSNSAQSNGVNLTVDASVVKGPMKPIWAWFGHDEPNYTYLKDGKKLLN